MLGLGSSAATMDDPTVDALDALEDLEVTDLVVLSSAETVMTDPILEVSICFELIGVIYVKVWVVVVLSKFKRFY